MRNYVEPGHTLPLIAPYEVASGGGFLVGSIFAFAKSTAVAGGSVQGVTVGVFDHAKAAGAVTQGQKLYWDNAAKVLTTTASGNTSVGVAVQAQASADPQVRVKLGSYP